jgi:hypothetical protein
MTGSIESGSNGPVKAVGSGMPERVSQGLQRSKTRRIEAEFQLIHSYWAKKGARSRHASPHAVPDQLARSSLTGLRYRSAAVMVTLSALLFENGLPNLPALLIEPHRNPGGIWRIKFSYETSEPLSMSAVQASTMASSLHEIGEAELADEIDVALQSAARYSSM